MYASLETLKTDRLHVRKLKPSDVEAIFGIFSDPEVTKYWDIEQMTDQSQAEDFIRETQRGFQDHTLLEWGIIETQSERLIGTCAYADWDQAHERAEIGFALHKNFWGRGLMKEFLAVFIPFGFSKMGLHRIEADVDPRNQASIKLLEYFGFKKEGYLRERYLVNGEREDTIYYGLLRSDCSV